MSKGHQIERSGSGKLEIRMCLHPSCKFLRQGHVLAYELAQALHPIPSDHKPQLQ